MFQIGSFNFFKKKFFALLIEPKKLQDMQKTDVFF